MSTTPLYKLAVAGAIIALVIELAPSSASASVESLQWQFVAPMPAPRAYHAAATLRNLWYVAGGINNDSAGQRFPKAVDAYDPTIDRWDLAGEIGSGREYGSAAADAATNTVLFSGGFVPDYVPMKICDLLSSGIVAPGSQMLFARYLHASAFVAGRFIVSGGWGATPYSVELDSTEVLDGGAWMSTGAMPGGRRAGHTMTTLRDDKIVLVVGGCLPDQAMTATDEYNAESGSWSATAPLNRPRCRHTALLLGDGRVMVSGSLNLLQVDNSAEIFSPSEGLWKMAAAMRDARYDHDMVLLPDGRVLVAGGTADPVNGESGALASAEVYDPATDAWTAVPSMNAYRRWPRLAVLSDGVYVAGGSNGGGVLSTVERISWAALGVSMGPSSDAGGAGCSCDAASAPRRGWAFVFEVCVLLYVLRRLTHTQRGDGRK